MQVIVGLGNPGAEYAGTRHNIGFEIIDSLCKRFEARMKLGDGEYLYGKIKAEDSFVYLIKPLTYMNNSGEAVADAVQQFGTKLEDLLIVCDDFQLPLGKLRLRVKGSDGGHNGLRSIIFNLQTGEFPRLRCGIAGETMPAQKSEMAQYVLSEFENSEKEFVREMTKRAADAVERFMQEGISGTMNKFNT